MLITIAESMHTTHQILYSPSLNYHFQQTFESLSGHQKDSMIKNESKRCCAQIHERSTERRSTRQNNSYRMKTRSADPKIRKWPKRKILYIIILLKSVCRCSLSTGHSSCSIVSEDLLNCLYRLSFLSLPRSHLGLA